MIGALLDGGYIIGVIVALVFFWRDFDPLGEARAESSDWAGGMVFLATLFLVVFLAVVWPLVLVFVGAGWVVGTLIGKVVRR